MAEKIKSELKATYVYYAIKPLLVGAIFAAFLFSAVYNLTKGKVISGIVSAILGAVPLLFFLIAIGQLIACGVYTKSYRNYQRLIEGDNDRVIVVEGLQGTGKTDTIKRAAIIKAAAQWATLEEEYLYYSTLIPSLLLSRDKVIEERWQEVRNAYRFWKRHSEFYPCLLSNCGYMQIGDKQVAALDYAMFIQNANLGFRSVVIWDEPSASGLTNLRSGREDESMDETFRFLRQFYEGYLYCAEQDKSKVIMNLRRVAVNYTMRTMRANVLTPRLLKRIYDRQYARIKREYGGGRMVELRPRSPSVCRYGYAKPFRYVNRYYFSIGELRSKRLPPRERLAKYYTRLFRLPVRQLERLGRLKALIGKIGYIQYTRVYRGSTEGNNVVDANKSATEQGNGSKTLKYYMPAVRLYDGDSRVFSGINKARSKAFSPKKFCDRIMTREYWDGLSQWDQKEENE